MPKGKGTYGDQVGRPSENKKYAHGGEIPTFDARNRGQSFGGFMENIGAPQSMNLEGSLSYKEGGEVSKAAKSSSAEGLKGAVMGLAAKKGAKGTIIGTYKTRKEAAERLAKLKKLEGDTGETYQIIKGTSSGDDSGVIFRIIKGAKTKGKAFKEGGEVVKTVKKEVIPAHLQEELDELQSKMHGGPFGDSVMKNASKELKQWIYENMDKPKIEKQSKARVKKSVEKTVVKALDAKTRKGKAEKVLGKGDVNVKDIVWKAAKLLEMEEKRKKAQEESSLEEIEKTLKRNPGPSE